MPYKDPIKQKESQKNYYEKNKDKYSSSMKTNRKQRHERIQTIKEQSPCADCGLFYRYYVMQFDHRDSAEKVESISKMLNRFSIDVIETEIAKCDLVCANCHAERSYKRKIGLQ